MGGFWASIFKVLGGLEGAWEHLGLHLERLQPHSDSKIPTTCTIPAEQQKNSQSSTSVDPSISKKLNDAISQIVELEGQLSILKQGKVRPNVGNIYLEETNARLQRQLQELKADEQELAQLVSELTNENRALKNDKKKARCRS